MRPIRRFGIPLGAAVVLLVAAAVHPAEAQTKTARGTATTVTDVSLTVKLGDKDMTFDVDSKTVVQASGAGRQTRAAQAAGAAGIKLTSVIQSGQPVLVTYREANGKNLATGISRISTVGSSGGSMSETPRIASGTVKSVSASSLVITSEGKDTTFAIDPATSVVGRGAGTAASAAGGRVVITSLVGSGDTVSVSYAGTAGAMRATEVRITAKAR
jgi:hypothetical protein